MKTTFSKQSIVIMGLFFLLGLTLYSQSKSKVFNEIANEEQKFTNAFAQSGGIGVKDFYADEAMILPPKSQPIGGNVAIANYWKGGYEAGVKSLKVETLEVIGGGDQANEIGSYTLYDQQSQPIDQGKYLVVWKKYNGRWKLYRDIWNSSKAQ